jgi:hypothetical protein
MAASPMTDEAETNNGKENPLGIFKRLFAQEKKDFLAKGQAVPKC